ncbi:MAG: sortase [Dehalococcoidia bacterium]
MEKILKSKTVVAAYLVAAIGLGLIGVAAVYAISSWRSGSDSAEYTYEVEPEQRTEYLGLGAPSVAVRRDSNEPVPLTTEFNGFETLAAPYPGNLVNPKYWAEPEWAGSDPFGGPTIPEEFTPVDSTSIFRDYDATSDAFRIRIPAIDVDAPIKDLAILDLGDSKEYETPDRVVGHIPETAEPGQNGNGWFFAHLESFAAGEGNIFRRLPEISDLVRQDPVDVYFETESAEFIYRVTQTSQIPESELRLSTESAAEVTLVTCWPPRVYDQRILVEATLIAFRET